MLGALRLRIEHHKRLDKELLFQAYLLKIPQNPLLGSDDLNLSLFLKPIWLDATRCDIQILKAHVLL